MRHADRRGAALRRSGLRIWIDALIVAVLMATFARTYLAQGLRIESGSMEGSLLAGDHVAVNRFVYAANAAPAWIQPLLPVRSARRGEVVVVRLPEEPRTLLVKRCVALPGDRVALTPGSRRPGAVGAGEDLPIDGYFVLGDRRERSHDSRAFGVVPARDLVGKPLFVYWSWTPSEVGRDGLATTLRDLWSRTRWRRTLRLVR